MGEYADELLERTMEEEGAFDPLPRYRRRRPEVIPVDAETRLLRQAAHRSFDRIWRQGIMTRGEAYLWLAGKLMVAPEEAHMGQMTSHDLLRQVVDTCDSYVGTTTAQDDFPDDL